MVSCFKQQHMWVLLFIWRYSCFLLKLNRHRIILCQVAHPLNVLLQIHGKEVEESERLQLSLNLDFAGQWFSKILVHIYSAWIYSTLLSWFVTEGIHLTCYESSFSSSHSPTLAISSPSNARNPTSHSMYLGRGAEFLHLSVRQWVQTVT